MAINQLHNRLEYLISYSSQLIFVGFDSLSQQQAALQQFISSQSESTEVAYINGDPDNTDADYRRLIYQQLAAKTQQSSSSLAEHLLTRLSKDSGPYLICVCAAQHISTELVAELWELVLNNKNQPNPHHLNVLLFGEPKWVAQAKAQLSTSSKYMPVILSSELLPSSATEFMLDDSISQNRKILRQTMQQPEHQQHQPSNSVLQTGWFKYAAAALFMLLFGSLVYWQYQPQIDGFLQVSYQPVAVDIEQESGLQDVSESQTLPLVDNAATKAENIDTQPSVRAKAQSPQLTSADDDNLQQLSTEQRVTDWSTEVKKMAQPASPKDNQNTDQSSSSEKIDSTDAPPDIQGAAIPEQTQSEPNNTVDLADNSIDTDRQKLLTWPSEHFALQLAAMADSDIALQFIQQNQLQSVSLQYVTQRFGGDWHVIVYNQSFASVAEARQAVSSLPASLDKSVPFAKSVKQIKDELVGSPE